jgi:hypothetical protein
MKKQNPLMTFAGVVLATIFLGSLLISVLKTPNLFAKLLQKDNSLASGGVWSADMETANLSQWTSGGTHGGSYDSGDCIRPSNGVSTEKAHTGIYSMKITANTSTQESGCRQFRHEESLTGNPYYYSAWFYIPQFVQVRDYWNIFQFKSETAAGLNDPFWVVDILNKGPNGEMRLVLRWKGAVAGPTAQDTTTGTKYYYQTLKNVPVGQWFNIESYLRQSDAYSGQIIVWQDGTEIFNKDMVRTKHLNGDERWSVNNYSNSLNPSTASLYIDDAVISTSPTYSGVSATILPTSSPTSTTAPSVIPISSDQTKPIVRITNPTEGGILKRGATNTLSADASDDGGITKVQFYINGSLKCTDTSYPYNCNWKVPNRRSTTYKIRADASDASGNIGSASVSAHTN